jgi:hypothetical protein
LTRDLLASNYYLMQRPEIDEDDREGTYVHMLADLLHLAYRRVMM